MHAISSYRGNTPTHTPTNTHTPTHPQTGPITVYCAAASAQCNDQNQCTKFLTVIELFSNYFIAVYFLLSRTHSFIRIVNIASCRWRSRRLAAFNAASASCADQVQTADEWLDRRVITSNTVSWSDAAVVIVVKARRPLHVASSRLVCCCWYWWRWWWRGRSGTSHVPAGRLIHDRWTAEVAATRVADRLVARRHR